MRHRSTSCRHAEPLRSRRTAATRGRRDRPARLGIVRALDPNALRRAHLGADSARRAADLTLALGSLVVDQEGDEAELLRDGELLLRGLHRKNAGALRPLAHLERFVVEVAAAQPTNVIDVAAHEVFERYAQAFQNSGSKHRFLRVRAPGAAGARTRRNR